MIDFQSGRRVPLARKLFATTAMGLLFVTAAPAIEPALAADQAIDMPTLSVKGKTGSFKSDVASSPKFTAPLLDTPQTVSVIPQEVFRQQGARNLTDVLKNTPGISFNAGENGFATGSNNFSMRGFDASANIFIDGSRDSGSYGRDVFNIEQVEVVKGAAADNGRGGPGGYINLVTKTPKLENFVSGELSYGFDEYDSKDRKRAAIDGNYVLSSSTALRLNAMIEDSGVPGRAVAENNAWGIAPSLTFGLGTPFRATLSYEHQQRQDRPDWGVPGATIEGLITFNPAFGGTPRDAFYGLSSDFDDSVADTILARFEYDLGSHAMISNQTRWSRVDRTSRFTMPTGIAGGLVTTAASHYDRENTTLSNLTNLALHFDTGAISHRVSTGLEFTREKSEAGRFGAAVPATGSTNPFTPNPNRIFGSPFGLAETNNIEVDTVAVYAYDTMSFGEQWELTGGLRLEHYNVDIVSKTAAGLPSGAFDGYEQSKTTLGGKIGLVYKPVENGSVYASFGVSDQPPGSYLSNPDISRTADNAFPGLVTGAKGITSFNYEVGAKWETFGGRLIGTAALFLTEKKDVPIIGSAVVSGPTTLVGYGKQVVKGLEIGLSGKITEEWNIFAGAVFMDSERKHSATLDRLLYNGNPGDRGSNPAISTNGDELAFTPKVSANLWTTYRFPFGLTIGGGLQHVGSSYLGRPDDALRVIPNGRFGKLPSYTIVNALVSYELTENVNVSLYVENIGDKDYASSANWAGSRASLGNPRTFIVTTGVKF